MSEIGWSIVMNDLGLSETGQSLVERAAALAAERFAPRAADYDQQAAFPVEDFRDLFEAGCMPPPSPRVWRSRPRSVYAATCSRSG